MTTLLDPCGDGHDFVVTEIRPTTKGADQVAECSRCGVLGWKSAQAAVRDARPPLDG